MVVEVSFQHDVAVLLLLLLDAQSQEVLDLLAYLLASLELLFICNKQLCPGISC